MKHDKPRRSRKKLAAMEKPAVPPPYVEEEDPLSGMLGEPLSDSERRQFYRIVSLIALLFVAVLLLIYFTH